MEFGNVPQEELANIDFTLPDDHPMTNSTLHSVARASALKVYVGCTTWTQKPWIGKLYPPGTKDSGYGSEYARQFNTIEFGPTFYAIPKTEDVQSKWISKISVNPEFKFCLRFPSVISHIRRLKNAESLTNQFFDSLSGFGD